MSLNRKKWLRFRLSTMLIAYAVLAVVMAALAPSALTIGHRLGFAALLLLPIWLGWKSVLYQTPFLLSFGSGLSVGALTFLALCFLNLVEAKIATGAAHMTIGVVGSVVGFAIARTKMDSSDIAAVSQPSRLRFRSFLTLVIALSALLALVFAGGRTYFAWIRNSQVELSATVESWDAALFFEQSDLPWNLDGFLVDKVLVPRGICFYDQVPTDAASLLALPKTITMVGLRGKNIDDESLARIPASLELEHLILFSTRVTDDSIRLLRQWPGIVDFYLFDAPITFVGMKRLAQFDLIKVMVVIGSQITPDEKQMQQMLRRVRPKKTHTHFASIRPGQEYPGRFPRYLRALIFGDGPPRDKQLRTVDLNEWRLWIDSRAFK